MDHKLVTILVVEDNADDASLLRNLLWDRWDGRFRMIHVEDLSTALEICKTERIDVTLLDLNLPDSHGLETFLRYHAAFPDVPVVLLSDTENERLSMRAVQSGAQDYLSKDQLDDHLLVRSVRYAIERSRREDAEEALRITAAKFRVAREIQQRLFPKKSPLIDGFEMAGISYPADETGGDYFDFVPMPQDRLGLIVGDVSSHGLGPALLMAETRAYLRALATSSGDVGDVLTRVNRILAEDTEGKNFVTLMFARLDPASRELVYAGAGHAGYIIEPDGTAKMLNSTCLPLGIDGKIKIPTAKPVQLCSGQILFICTDGINEAESPSRQMLGMERVLERIHANQKQSATEIVDDLYELVREFTAGRPQQDDITALVLKVE